MYESTRNHYWVTLLARFHLDLGKPPETIRFKETICAFLSMILSLSISWLVGAFQNLWRHCHGLS